MHPTFTNIALRVGTCLVTPWIAAAAELAPGIAPLEFGGASGTTREFAATVEADYARESFQAEVTVTIKSGHAGHGIAFVGMGKGAANAAQFNEPTTAPSLVFRLCPSDFGGGQVTAAINGEAAGDPVVLGDGTHRVRVTWDAKRKQAWLEIHPQWKSGDVFAAKLRMSVSAQDLDFGNDGRIFVGGAGGATFADFSVRAVAVDELSRLPVNDSFAKDASAGTWLPVEGASALAKGDAGMDAFLKELRANLRPVACWYKGAQLQASRALPGGQLSLPQSKWELAQQVKEVPGAGDARDVTLTLSLKEGQAEASGLAAAFDFSDWSKDNYVLIPGAVYNGNRLRTIGGGYNAGLPAADYGRRDLPLTQNDVPRLEIEDGKPSKLEVSACNVTAPAICVFDQKAKRGFIVLAEQAGRDAKGEFLAKANGELLDNAFAVEENADRSRATLVIGAPGVRSRKPEFVGFSGSPDRGLVMKAGDAITLKLRVYSFAAADIPALLDRYSAVRKAVTGPNHPRLLAPASQVEQWMTARIESRYLQSPKASFYCPENGPWIAFGWIGGWMNTAPMLVQGDAEKLRRVTTTFDHGFKAQTPAGHFRYAIDANGNTAFREPRKDATLTRCEGDMLFWMVKQFELLKAQNRGQAVKPEWEAGIRKLADALVATWKKDGQWGKMIQVETGAVYEFNTTGGATVIGGLALASAHYRNPEYLKIAKDAARFYFERDIVKLGMTSGACADILQHAESETSYAFVNSMMTLYEVTGEREWLDKARTAAALFSTWIVAHDYILPKTTELGGLDAKLAGVFWASTQNKHGAPGICTASGDALFKLGRATGDARPAELVRDIVRAHGESIRPGGFTNERLTFCDAEARGSRGDHVTGWCETNGILMAQELPGIYVRSDADLLFVYDAVEVKVLSRGPTGVKLEVRNPTKFDAKVSVLAEDAKQAQKPLGPIAFIRWPKVEVKAGETRTLEVSANGTVR